MRELVGLADDEILEGEARIERGIAVRSSAARSSPPAAAVAARLALSAAAGAPIPRAPRPARRPSAARCGARRGSPSATAAPAGRRSARAPSRAGTWSAHAIVTSSPSSPDSVIGRSQVRYSTSPTSCCSRPRTAPTGSRAARPCPGRKRCRPLDERRSASRGVMPSVAPASALGESRATVPPVRHAPRLAHARRAVIDPLPARRTQGLRRSPRHDYGVTRGLAIVKTAMTARFSCGAQGGSNYDHVST